MSGKVKSLHGVYKALGRDAFLAAAKVYSNHVQKYIRDNFMPYDYWYTADVEDDIHVSFDNIPEDVENLIAVAKGETQNEEFGMKM